MFLIFLQLKIYVVFLPYQEVFQLSLAIMKKIKIEPNQMDDEEWVEPWDTIEHFRAFTQKSSEEPLQILIVLITYLREALGGPG